ncbi:MAG: CTB family bacteriocin [Calothrix sp. C42_A2020_038]|nr:CTB family bacteriocin [Calothrix sp. C42_A2020_038]
MSNETNNIYAIELSLDELDNLAGGLSLIIGDVKGFASDANNSFYQKTLTVGQQTFAGPNGSYTASLFKFQETASSAGQSIVIG